MVTYYTYIYIHTRFYPFGGCYNSDKFQPSTSKPSEPLRSSQQPVEPRGQTGTNQLGAEPTEGPLRVLRRTGVCSCRNEHAIQESWACQHVNGWKATISGSSNLWSSMSLWWGGGDIGLLKPTKGRACVEWNLDDSCGQFEYT